MLSFTHHPSQVCMTYFSHLKLSLTLSSMFFKASVQAFLHAIFPFMYIKSSTKNCMTIQKLIDQSGCRKFP